MAEKKLIFKEGWEKSSDAQDLIKKVREFHSSLSSELGKVIVGQKDVVDQIVIAMLCRGNVLLEGVPGLGKTLIFRTLSQIMHLDFHHVQFTPDLMPSDILGTEVIQQNKETNQREMQFLKGPIFCNFLLADEVNRASPRTQSALLQAMQDRQVSIGNITYDLEAPFFVLATQNPIEQEGVYPLPEAQLDRFMFNIFIEYPEYEEEVEIAKRYSQHLDQEVSTLIQKEDLLQLQEITLSMLISEHLLRYAVDIVTATRPGGKKEFEEVTNHIQYGAGPRASIQLILAAKARALLNGRLCAAAEDLRVTANSVLRHRIKLNFTAQAEGLTTEDVIKQLLKAVPEPKKKG